MIRIALFLLASSLLCAQDLYKDPSAPLDRRVDDLVSRMTLEEKVSQLTNDAAAIPRLGVPAYNWWNECLHGVARAGRATVFPETIGMAATWDPELIFRIATVISDEARAKHQEFLRRGKHGIYQGLTFWTPNINLFRDPRWGRGMETYGEDPYLTARMAVPFIRGLQGDDPKYFKAIATAKHYAVHSGPESTRHSFDARVDERDLRDTYLPQFEAAVKEGGAYSVMCAYNRVDGDPACASPRLLETILRKEWGFPGYVVSDCGAIGDIWQFHKVAPNAPDGVSRAIKAGCDLDCGMEYRALIPAVKQGLVSEAEVTNAVRRLMVARFRLGMFDPPEMVKWAQIPYSVNDSKEHAALALETARKSIVLLKNDNNALPLRKDLKTVAVIGPNADSVEVLLGNYNGDPSAPVTPLEGIRRKLAGRAKVLYAQGCELAQGLPSLDTVPSSALFTSDSGANGLNAEYFNTANFSGRMYQRASAVARDAKPLFTRTDPRIDFKWWDGAPRQDMNDDDFGVRWTGFLKAPVSGTYSIGAVGMNAAEIWFDGKRIVNFNNMHERSWQYATLPLEAGKLYPIKVEFHEYVNDADIRLVWSVPGRDFETPALQAAKQADTVIMVLGLSPRLEGEEMRVPVAGFKGGDRIDLGIPAVQEQLLEKIAALGKPIVVVLLNGSAVAVNWAREHVPAIVELWYPGQAGGTALADVLFGDYNPSGRLPVTFYKSAADIPPFENYDMKGKTYRFFEGEPLFPFGYGLSYTKFVYSNLELPTEAQAGSELKASVEVENAGKRAGEEVVEVYVKHKAASVPVPVRALAGIQRVALKPGEKKRVEIALTASALSLIDAQDRRMAQPGSIEIAVGGKQPGFGGLADAATTQVLTRTVNLHGPAKCLDYCR